MAGFLTRSVPKPCIVLAPTARCVTCTLPVLTLVTCIKNVSLQNKLRPVNFYIDYFSRFHTIISEYFRNTNYPMTCHWHVRRLARLKGSMTFSPCTLRVLVDNDVACQTIQGSSDSFYGGIWKICHHGREFNLWWYSPLQNTTAHL